MFKLSQTERATLTAVAGTFAIAVFIFILFS
mgnify:CR=1 FL=1